LGGDGRAVDRDGVPGWERTLVLQPGESTTVVFLLTWHFPNIYPLWGFPAAKRHYAATFADAPAVAQFAADNYARLSEETGRWVATWYDSTLPAWLMDRSILTANTLQTANCFIFEDGQFWAWEGIGACAGTCTHVWQYAQSPARLFPSLERNLREVTDYGYAQNPKTGMVSFRGVNPTSAVDGQAGIVLRTLREHQVSADDAFLRRVWPHCKFALQGLMAHDVDGDGLLDGAQHNTLDSDWYGEVAWLSGLYLAAVRAGEQLAGEIGDEAFAQQCRELVERGSARLVERLFDRQRGYFINRLDPEQAASVNSGTGCHIDQVFGQSWAFQVGLERVLPAAETTSALRALWRHNFKTDVGPWRMHNKPGRWYAVPGEAGLVMCTFPTPDWDYSKALGVDAKDAWSAMYFNECMSGFEYQVAAHMLYENQPDLIQTGLAITRAVHDRYAPAKRNPYNEIECSDHYARAASGYGVFLAACGFDYHGPAKRIGFAPRISAENFRAPFTAAEGWGTFSQQHTGQAMDAHLHIRYGKLRLQEIVLQLPREADPQFTTVTLNGQPVGATLERSNGQARIRLLNEVVLMEGAALSIAIGQDSI
jgi:non-lysosomal glucosylceramidase